MVASGAEVAEWQTRWSQKPLRATSCGFDSRSRHQLAKTDAQRAIHRAHPAAAVGGQELIRLRLADFAYLISLEARGANTDGLCPPTPRIEPNSGHGWRFGADRRFAR